MSQEKNDKLFKQIASQYIKNDGVVLDEEAQRLNQTHAVMPGTPEKTRRKRWIPWVSTFGTAAVILFIVVNVMLVQFIFDRNKNANLNPPEASSPTQSDGPQWQAPGMTLASNNRFTIEEVIVDNGQHIYKIGDAIDDDAVVTLMSPDSFSPETMKSTNISGRKIYYKNEMGYKLVALEKDDWVITLSCALDMDTLSTLFGLIEIDSEKL